MSALNKSNVNHSRSVPPQDRKNRPRDNSPLESNATPNAKRELKKPFRSVFNVSNNQGNQANQSETDAFRVYVRARPLNSREQNSIEPEKRANIIKKEDNMVKKSE